MTAHRGQCYCGFVRLRACAPQTVSFCHCASCRRWTGAPVAAFAAFSPDDLKFTPSLGDAFSTVPGVDRWVCPKCGSALAATFDYLPDQVYVPLGLFDDIDAFPPKSHSHYDEKANWLHIEDDLPRNSASGRAQLSAAKPR